MSASEAAIKEVSDVIGSLKYRQTSLGRIQSLFDLAGWADLPITSRVMLLTGKFLLFLVAVPNIFFFANLFGVPLAGMTQLGSVGGALLTWPIQPMTVGVFLLELAIVGATVLFLVVNRVEQSLTRWLSSAAK